MRAKKINEILQPNRNIFNLFKDIVTEIKDSKTDDPFYDLNSKLNPHSIFLYDFENYFEQVSTEERDQFKEANMLPELGIRMVGFDSPSKRLFILCDKTFDDKFVNIPKYHLERLLNRLWSGFGHETIHMQQVGKMKVKQDPEFKSKKEYFGNKQEIMAMAFSFIEEMSEFHSNEEILNLLKTGQAPSPPMGMMAPSLHHPLYSIYKELGGKEYKLFTKYAYQYLKEKNENI
jgi:hypothetical protein